MQEATTSAIAQAADQQAEVYRECAAEIGDSIERVGASILRSQDEIKDVLEAIDKKINLLVNRSDWSDADKTFVRTRKRALELVVHEALIGIQQERLAARHPGAEVPAVTAKDDDGASGHVLARVVADTLDDGDRAGVANGEPLTRRAGAEELAAGRPVEHRVADEARLARVGTRDPAAYQDFLRARNLWSQRSVASLNAAVDAFQAALARDPGFAHA